MMWWLLSWRSLGAYVGAFGFLWWLNRRLDEPKM